METPVIQAPAAPENLPEKLKAQWKQNWIKEFKQAVVDHPGDETTQRAVAARAANRMLNPDEPTSYEEAMALEPWQVLFRGDKNGRLCVVLINTKKFYFDYPKGAEAQSSATSEDAVKAEEARKAEQAKKAGNNGKGK